MASPASFHVLEAPTSSSIVRVQMMDTTSIMTIRSESFIKPVMKGHELINVTDVAYAGVRKDYWNLPEVIQTRLGDVIPGLRVDKDVTEILVDAGVPLQSIGQS